MKKILVFASGNGSNAERLAQYFSDSEVRIEAIVCNNPNAGVITRAWGNRIPVIITRNQSLIDHSQLSMLKSFQPDLIVLAGWLAKIPEPFIEKIGCPIINIHPSLLPKYGGKGMYGLHVHKAVIQDNEKESGITIHYVNNEYDSGNIIFQASTQIEESDNADILAHKIHELEYKHFPLIIEQLLAKEEAGNGKH